MKKQNRILLLIALICVVIQSCNEKAEQHVITLVNSPAAQNSEEPNLIKGGDGNLYLSWIEKRGKKAVLQYSKWEDSKWSSPEIIAEGSDWFVNWADYPAMAVNKSGDMIAHYLQMSDSGTYTYDIKVVAKKSNDNSWSEPIKLHKDSVNAEHGFVSMIPMENDEFFLAWLDGRNTTSMDMEEEGHDNHAVGGAMTVRTATLSPDLDMANETELDDRVCDCCQTSAAITDNGPIVVYRDRSNDEVRDMSIVRLVNESWTAPKSIHSDNWMIAGCPVNGPRTVSYGDNIDNLAVAWFTAAGDTAQVKLAFSDDSGENFEKPIRLDQGNGIGRVDVEYIDNKTILVSWIEETQIVAAKVSTSGDILDRYELATSTNGRSSGFPQIALIQGSIMIAWTDSEKMIVKTAILKL